MQWVQRVTEDGQGFCVARIARGRERGLVLVTGMVKSVSGVVKLGV